MKITPALNPLNRLLAKVFALGGCLLLICLYNPQANAATTYTVRPWTNDADTGISSSNTYTVAGYLGASTVAPLPTTSLNGVTFTSVNLNGGWIWGPGFSSTYLDVKSGIQTNALTTEGGGSAVLASYYIGLWSGNYEQPINQGLSMTGLTIGESYQLSIFSVASDDATRNALWTFRGGVGDPNQTTFMIDQNAYGDDKGIIVDIFYTASATTMNLIFDRDDNNRPFHLYAFANANAVVPEPSRALLGFIAIGACLLRRRRNYTCDVPLKAPARWPRP